jgi:hypothetical protein
MQIYVVVLPGEEYMRKIKLSNGHVAIVDDKDFELLNQWKWTAWTGPSGNTYAIRHVYKSGKPRKYERVFMHRLLVGMTKGDKRTCDHKNGKTLDNRRTNLRECTNQQNQGNRELVAANNTSGHKGVCWLKNREKWRAKIVFNGRTRHLGTFVYARTIIVRWAGLMYNVH